jgi:hypothetical protein
MPGMNHYLDDDDEDFEQAGTGFVDPVDDEDYDEEELEEDEDEEDLEDEIVEDEDLVQPHHRDEAEEDYE